MTNNPLIFNDIVAKKERLDKILSELLHKSNLSRSRIQKLIEQGHVKVNDITVTDSSAKFSSITKIEVKVPEPEPTHLVPKDSKSFEVIFEDENLMVINKPAGITVHPGAGNYQDTLVNELISYAKDTLSSVGGIARPGIVHRLDKDTSGLMLIAKNDLAHLSLSEQLKTRELSRNYLALCFNQPAPKNGTIITNIGRDFNNRTKMKVVNSGGKEAITIYETKEKFDEYFSLIECKLKTGRTHQIRVHLSHIGCPIIGDQVYGGRNKTAKLPDELKLLIKNFPRQALHAYKIGFIHPKTQKVMEFEVDLAQDIKELLSEVRNYV